MANALIYTHSAVTVGNTSTAILGANQSRVLLILQNISNEAMFFNLAGAAAADQTGLKLQATGTVGDTVILLEPPRDAVKGICASGSKTLLVTEGTRS